MFLIGSFLMTSGIYVIRNRESGKCCIGQSVDVHRRWEQHKRKIDAVHHNGQSGATHLMWLDCTGDFDALFEFILLEETPHLNEREKMWQQHYTNAGVPLYNVMSCGGSHGRHSEETKRKISLANATRSDETKRKMRAGIAKSQHLRVKKLKKPVVNLDTGEVYDSAVDADQILGLYPGAIQDAIRKLRLADGSRWAKVADASAQLARYNNKLRSRWQSLRKT